LCYLTLVLIKLYNFIRKLINLEKHACILLNIHSCTSNYSLIYWSSLVLCVRDGTRVLNGHVYTCAYFNVTNCHSQDGAHSCIFLYNIYFFFVLSLVWKNSETTYLNLFYIVSVWKNL